MESALHLAFPLHLFYVGITYFILRDTGLAVRCINKPQPTRLSPTEQHLSCFPFHSTTPMLYQASSFYGFL